MADPGWTKVRNELPDDWRVHAIAVRLRIGVDAVLGKLVRLWVWANKQQTGDEEVRGLTYGWVDAKVEQSGFAEAMDAVGWLVKTDTGFRLPNFGEHNWEAGRSKALAAERQRRHREGLSRPERDGGVTGALQKRHLPRPIPGPKKNTPPTPPAGGCPEPPSAGTGPSPPPLLTFPCLPGKKGGAEEWHLTAELAAELSAAYPDVDVPAEARKALVWVKANRRKTHRGMPAFLARWMAREQDRGGRPGGPAGGGRPRPSAGDGLDVMRGLFGEGGA